MDIIIIGNSHTFINFKDIIVKMAEEYNLKVIVVDSLEELIMQTRNQEVVLEPGMNIIDLNNLEKRNDFSLLLEEFSPKQEKIINVPKYTKKDIKSDNKIYMKKLNNSRR